MEQCNFGKSVPLPIIKAASHKELLLRSKIVNAKYMCLRRINEVLDNEINIFIAA